ncbi:MAG: lamin tail domain-containing protein, partial [Candidatus Latescibacteria bacterium]|nr:lamin tail domain-containing protein [Candidatus Latescibacterota bacterium]
MLANIIIIIPLLFSQQYSRIVINEVMANPRGVTGAGYPEDRNEFVELFNVSQETVDVCGWRITDF